MVLWCNSPILFIQTSLWGYWVHTEIQGARCLDNFMSTPLPHEFSFGKKINLLITWSPVGRKNTQNICTYENITSRSSFCWDAMEFGIWNKLYNSPLSSISHHMFPAYAIKDKNCLGDFLCWSFSPLILMLAHFHIFHLVFPCSI